MMISGASTSATKFEVDVSRFNEITRTTVRRGHHGFRERPNWNRLADLSPSFAAPLKAGAIKPEAADQNGDLPATAIFAFLNPLRLGGVGSQQPIAPA